jgi:short-subunit dehydrogenase
VTGFFEALRTELEDFNVAITIVCPPSVATPMREHDLMLQAGHPLPKEPVDERISTDEAVKIIMDATDRRARKVPNKP